MASKLYDITGAHNTHWYKFIKLTPKPELEEIPKPGNEHARVAFCTKCHAEINFEKGRSYVKKHLQEYHWVYLRDQEAVKEAKRTGASSYLRPASGTRKKLVTVTS